MTDLLIRIFLNKNKSMITRHSYGRLTGIVGITANLILFLIKLIAGLLSSSIAVIADGFNNLSDAGSSVVTLVGFRLASTPPDKEHPFGHGRMEYITTMVIAIMILFAGIELVRTSLDKIINPTAAEFGWVTIIILVVAIAIKLWLALFYRKIADEIDSEALVASSVDSRNDVICTTLVLVSALIGWFTSINIDGYVGVGVAVFVMWSGVSILRDTVSPLLGQAPSPQLVKDIKDTVLAYQGIIGLHDLIVHNYGPGKCIVSLHAEVSSEDELMHSHDLIDRIEREITEKYNAAVCIHLDPVDIKDERVNALRTFVDDILEGINPSLSLHDFRVVFGETHTNLIFDLVVPFKYKNTRDLREKVEQLVQESNPQLFTVITIEHSYT
ncbi:MAG: cation diffusion facilitator family transporter [Oscillospiraceae bacterium]|nr:cation diffusion facilitator family transporter [Oscillospiraceae bacterium]MDD3833508.1 cation diffusion facilitator family transporter [Oscillospiraceae bacterium]